MSEAQIALSRRYLRYRFCANLWFIGAVWLFFYRIFLTDYQVGILDALAFSVGILAEIPSGALADKFGRARLVKIGHILAGIGLFIQALGSSFLPFCVGQAIVMIGLAFTSGADEALFFEKIGFDEKAKNWRRLSARAGQVGLAATLIATMIGGFLHMIDPRISWILNAIAFIGAAMIIWPINDDKAIIPATQKSSITHHLTDYIIHIQMGFRQFITPNLWFYVPIILIIQGLFYTSAYGILRLILLDRFGFDPLWSAGVITLCSLITIGLLAYMHKRANHLNEKSVIFLICLSAAIGLILSVYNIGQWGGLVILALIAGEYVLNPFMSEILNYRTTNQYRSTVLSVASFFKMLPYIALAPIIGYLNTHHHLEYFLIIWAILILIALLIYMLRKRNNSHIDLTQPQD